VPTCSLSTDLSGTLRCSMVTRNTGLSPGESGEGEREEGRGGCHGRSMIGDKVHLGFGSGGSP